MKSKNELTVVQLISLVSKDYRDKIRDKGMWYTFTIGTYYYLKTMLVFKIIDIILNMYVFKEIDDNRE